MGRGCIIKRGNVWYVVVDIARGPDGKRKQKWYPAGQTKKEAQRRLVKVLASIDDGAYVEPSKQLLSDYLERWLKDYAKPCVAAKTCERYAEIIHNNISPALGHLRIDSIKPLDIQRFYSDCLDHGRKDGKGGLSKQTVLHFHRVLHNALEQAVRWQVIVKNPAEFADPPRPNKRLFRVLDADQSAELLDSASSTPLYMPVLLALTTGMRRGEILGLSWADVSFEDSTVCVRQSLSQTDAGLEFKEPKAGKSRVIAVPELTMKALREHRTAQIERRLLVGAAYIDSDLVCPRVDGTPWPPDTFTPQFIKMVLKLGIPRISFNDCRHTHATHLLKLGVHPKIVSERLGHSKVGITLDIYSHVLPNMQADAAKLVDLSLKSAISNQRLGKGNDASL